MGPLNEFQRRFLDVTEQNMFLRQANAGGPPPEYFGYVLQLGNATTPLTNGVSFQGVIAIQADAWFLWQYLQVGVTLPGGAPLYGGPDQLTDAGNLMLQITMPGTGDELYNVPAGFAGFPASLTAGTPLANLAGIPYVFPTPVLLPPKTNLNVTVQKYGTNAGADNPDPTGAWIMLNGARIQVWS